MSEMNEATGNMAREELRESTLRIESLSAQLAGLQREVDMHFPCEMTFSRLLFASFYYFTVLEALKWGPSVTTWANLSGC